MSETYQVIKPFKGDGKQYQPGDAYKMSGGAFEHKLVGRYIQRVDEEQSETMQVSKLALYARRQRSLQPEKYAVAGAVAETEDESFICGDCGFEAKSAAGLTSHARKHQEG